MPKLEPIKVMGFRCQRCGHAWVPHDPDKPPVTCPKCKSPFWDKKRREKSSTNAMKSIDTTDDGKPIIQQVEEK